MQAQDACRPKGVRYVVYLSDRGEIGHAALAQCLTYVEREHPDWQGRGVVVGAWSDVLGMLVGGLADVVVVAQRSDLPPDRMPRVVAVDEEPAQRLPARRGHRCAGVTQRRPRLRPEQ